MKKLSYKYIYKDFRKRYPILAKSVEGWQPHGYMSIEVYTKEGTKIVYDYITGRGAVSKERWKG